MAQLNLIPRSTKSLVRYPAQGKLVVEASDLGLRPGHQWERLYDDACDVGIALLSHRTGTVVRWYLQEGETVTDAEGEVVCWKLRPCSESLRLNPDVAHYTLHILND